MKYYISVNLEDEITINDKTLIPNNWKPSEIRPILEDFGLNSDGSLKNMLIRLNSYIENEIKTNEKECEEYAKKSDIIQKSINVYLEIEKYISENAVSMCEFLDGDSISEFIDLHE